MVALTQVHVDEDKRLRAAQYALFPRMKALPKIAAEQPQTLRADDQQAREGIIPGAGGKYPAKRRR